MRLSEASVGIAGSGLAAHVDETNRREVTMTNFSISMVLIRTLMITYCHFSSICPLNPIDQGYLR